nr:iron ABC transporter permease [Komagataeibacter sp. FNDCR2]
MPRLRAPVVGFVCIAALVVLAGGSACVGRFPLRPEQVLGALLAAAGLTPRVPPVDADLVHTILFGARLPRIGGAMCVGAALSVAGAAYQAVFRNPLVSPGLLGVLAGAGTGAALGIVWGLGTPGVAALSFVGGLAAVGFGVGVAHMFDAASMMMLVFGGLISSALFTALLSLLKYIADPQNQLPDIVFWLLGSLTQVSAQALGVLVLPVVVGIVLLSACGRMLDGLAMGDEEARTLGIPVMALRYGVIGAATVLAAMTVSVAGMIGWVGLVVPHVARLLVGPCNMRVLPVSACIGAMFLLVCDDLARTLSVEEIPVGLIADLLGVVVFVAVLPLLRRGWRA